MEKCNYCLQRISRARRQPRRKAAVAEGEVVTACQAACPTRAIHFGDLNREDSAVASLRQEPRHYTLLAELEYPPAHDLSEARAQSQPGAGCAVVH